MFRRCPLRLSFPGRAFLLPRSTATPVSSYAIRALPLRLGTAVTSVRLYSTSRITRKQVNAADSEDGNSLLDFEYDPMASVQHDAAVETAKQSLDTIAQDLAPEHAPPDALTKIREYLEQHPVDRLIVATNVQITHVQNAETDAEDKVNLSPCPLEDALEQARLRGLNLVQMGVRQDTAFCRIRDERPWLAKLVAEDMKEVEAMMAAQAGDAAGGQHGAGGAHRGKTRPLIDHNFRDVVDAHFVGWKSKKICQDIKKGHPVKLTIKEFQSAESAVFKLQEMCAAMQRYSEEQHIYNHFTSIVANDRELSITFSPAGTGKSGTVSNTVKYPGEKEWTHTLKRLQNACQKVGRSGTYVKSAALKPRNIGATTYRVDKFGRRID